MKKEHQIETYFSDDNSSEISDIVTWTFTMKPFEIVSVRSEQESEKTPELTQENKQRVMEMIQDWLFKKSKSPFPNAQMWRLKEPFDEEDKKHIKQIFIMEEL